MRIFIVILLSLCALSCAGPAKYDNVEFAYYADIRHAAALLEEACGNPFVEVRLKTYIQSRTGLLSAFGQYGLYPDSKGFAEKIHELIENFTPGRSFTYCKLSADGIRLGAEEILKTLGRRMR